MIRYINKKGGLEYIFALKRADRCCAGICTWQMLTAFSCGHFHDPQHTTPRLHLQTIVAALMVVIRRRMPRLAVLLFALLAVGVYHASASAEPDQQQQQQQSKREVCDSTPEICATMAAFGGSLVVPQVIPVFKVSFFNTVLEAVSTRNITD
jgi:hypothetical protein